MAPSGQRLNYRVSITLALGVRWAIVSWGFTCKEKNTITLGNRIPLDCLSRFWFGIWYLVRRDVLLAGLCESLATCWSFRELRRGLRFHTLYVCFAVAKSCPTFCDPMDCSTPGFPVPHHLPEFYHSENPKVLKNYAKSTWPVFYKWNHKAWIKAHLFTIWFTEYFKPIVDTYCSEKKDSFQHSTAYWQCTWSFKSSDGDGQWGYMPTNTTSILQPMDQGVTSIFKCSYLTNTFCHSIAVIDRDSSVGSRQSKLKIFWKGFTIVDAIQNTHAL